MGFSGGINYQRKISDRNRLDLQLGVSFCNGWHGGYTYDRYSHWNTTYYSFDYDYAYSGDEYQYELTTFTLAGTYQWMWNITGGWNCYAGGGASLGYGDSYYRRDHAEPEWIWNSYGYYWFANTKHTNHYNNADGLDLGLQGVAGTEFRFRAPISASFEVRPWLHFIGFKKTAFSLHYNFGIRYTF